MRRNRERRGDGEGRSRVMKRKGLTSCLFTHYETDQKQDDESGLRGTDRRTDWQDRVNGFTSFQWSFAALLQCAYSSTLYCAALHCMQRTVSTCK